LGFFVTDPIKSGPHKVEFLINGQVVGANFATVVANEITTMTLAPSAIETSQPMASAGSQPETGALETSPALDQESAIPSAQTGQRHGSGGRSTERAATDPNGRIVLDADIEGATLSLNGRVVGAGNMAYTRLKPGRYTYQVSKEGYQSARGTVEVAAGDASTLSVQLAAARTAEKPSVSPEEEHYRAGMDALGASNYATAESELNIAVAAKPSYAAAYIGLGQTKTQNGHSAEASDDFLRAAEIYRVVGDPNNAMKAYNHAVQTNQTSVPALLGRGNLYLSRGEEIAAIADYEALLKFDRRNVQAYLGLGQARYAQGNPKAAIKHFKDARSIDPKNADIYEYLMLCYFAEDNFKEARKAYEDYKEIATSEQMTRIQHNPRFSAVLRVIGE
jgi:tetratricopeptide (TPR) repeat protein